MLFYLFVTKILLKWTKVPHLNFRCEFMLSTLFTWLEASMLPSPSPSPPPLLPMLMLKWNEQIQMQSKELFNNAPTIANGKLVLALELRAQNYKNTLHFRLYKFNVVDSLWLRFELYVVTSTFQFILVLPNIFTMFASFFFSLCSLLVVLHSFNVFFFNNNLCVLQFATTTEAATLFQANCNFYPSKMHCSES